MSGRGPVPKAKERKVYQRSRLPALRPKLDALPPVLAPAPAGLPVELVPLWEQIVDELDSRGGMASALRATDSLLISCLLEAVSVHRLASADVHARGLSIEGRFGETSNPSLRAQRDAAATILRLCGELGLSPAVRTRLGLMTIVGVSLLDTIARDVGISVVAAIEKARKPARRRK